MKALNKKKGMALVVVLAISSIILMLGIMYIDTFRQGAHIAGMQLETVQAEFFAKGIQNIALLKIKRFPDFFIRAYRHSVYQDRSESGDPGVSAPLFAFSNPSPYEKFLGIYAGRDRDVLHNIPVSDDSSWRFTEPIALATYSTAINLRTSEDFTQGFIEVVVSVEVAGIGRVEAHRISVASKQVAQ